MKSVSGAMEHLVFFLTGCTHGLGAALARALGARGALVFAGVYPGGPSHEETPPASDRLLLVPIDVAQTASVEEAARSVAARTRHVDVVMNVAGVLGDTTATPPGMTEEKDLHHTFDVNAVGALRVMQAFHALLMAGSTRLTVNISSEAGSIGSCTRTSWFGYCMSKAALNMASALAHNALRPLGGRVLVVHPGWVRTWMRGTRDARAELSAEESADAVLEQVGRALADPAAFSGAQPSFIDWTGRVLPW
ncbi:MAG TPA: SDR family NAD(P)-dependent oxidoreductase [bacterium]|nr:SDR family NAD(P)-dependent oxidoreductase [bacterium]